jgi:hypothetical protein
MNIPRNFDDDFLNWFRDRTNQAWSHWQTHPFSSYQDAGVGGEDWEQGTGWRAGLSEGEIDEIEAEWSIHFPPDYRLFLHRLHTVDRPMKGARFSLTGLVPTKEPSFYNWQRDREALRRRFAWPLEGLLFDLEHNDLWLEGWGPKPESLTRRNERLTELVENAPRLIPVYAHRYLLVEPCVADNPVFSIVQSDIIVYGKDLRSYLLVEFANLLGLNSRDHSAEVDEETMGKVQGIPFWGELIAHNEES